MLKIGIIGCGAIGSSLARAISQQFFEYAELVSLYDINTAKAYNLSSSLAKKKIVALTLENLINDVDLVIEASCLAAAYEIALKAISLQRDVMVMSVGGILDKFDELKALAEEKNTRLYLPSGAICGIDALKAAALGKIVRVTLVTKKPPRAFIGIKYILKQKISLEQIKQETVLFVGTASDAVRFFPQNINVAATLSLAGVGALETKVKIIAVPGLEKNIHEIEIEGDCGKIFTRTENVIHPDNPKTSYLAVLSAIAALKEILMPVKIGT